MTILVVDDETTELTSAERLLSSDGFKVVTATSVRGAIDVFQRGVDITLILCDIKMPGEDGFELLKFMSSNLRFANVPLVFCTGCADVQSVTQGIFLGARDYIIKPYNRENLLNRVQTVLESGKGMVAIALSTTLQAEALAASLTREGYKTAIVESPAALPLFLETHRIDVFITERELPGTSGMNLLLKVKSACPHVPVFFLEKYPTLALEEMLVAAGADGVIRVPISGQDIRTKLDNHRRLRRNRTLREIEYVKQLRKRDLDQAPQRLEVKPEKHVE